jgi:hypothetical protein
MDRSLTEQDLAKIRKLINTVDLSSTVDRLIKVHHWKEEWVLKAVQQYRNYLFLKIKYGKTHGLPPSVDIDEVWHAHILHTEEYIEFCQNAFGFFLHHHPHHGKDGEFTDADIAKAFEQETQKLYYSEFGEYIEAVMPLPFKVIIKRLISLLKINKKAVLATSESV